MFALALWHSVFIIMYLQVIATIQAAGGNLGTAEKTCAQQRVKEEEEEGVSSTASSLSTLGNGKGRGKKLIQMQRED